MPKPPDICGYAPLTIPSNRIDKRWLLLKDVINIELHYRESVINSTNAWVNHAITYKPDAIDEWSDPNTTFRRGYGDCEDIALLKRAILLHSGIPEENICLVLAHDLIARIDHAFLVVYDGHQWLTLDNRTNLTQPVAALRDYEPIEAFSGNNGWLYGKRIQ